MPVRSTYFYENGQKKEETTIENSLMNSRTLWHPSGAIMARFRYGQTRSPGAAIEAESFDERGESTGQVQDEVGFVVLENRIEVYDKNRAPRSIALPTLGLKHHYSPSSAKISGQLILREVGGATFEKVSIRLLLPKECQTTNNLEFIALELRPNESRGLGDLTIEFPKPFEEWVGEIRGEIGAVVEGKSVRYQPVALAKAAKQDQPATVPKRTRAPRPHELTSSYRSGRKGSPTVQGEEFPPYRLVQAAWVMGSSHWLLYRDPPVLLASADGGKEWAVLRRELSYQPHGLTILSAERQFLWGTKPTATPEKGIPFVVEASKDAGMTWTPLSLPGLDYLLGISANENVVAISGVRLPKEGLTVDQDWFELPRTTLLSRDGVAFTELAGPSFADIGKIEGKSTAPNGSCRAFVSNRSFLDASYAVYIAKERDSIPTPCWSAGVKPTLVWSENSKILAIQVSGSFTGCVEIETGRVEKSEGGKPPAGFDEKVRGLLDANRK